MKKSRTVIEETVKERFGTKCNCAQVVLTYAAEKLGIDEDLALRLASNFGGGMGKGETCGCVTGALMALGLKYGGPKNHPGATTLAAKKKDFETEFAIINEKFLCKELLGYDFSIPGERDKAVAAGLLGTVCPKLASDTCEILDKLLEED